MSQTQTNTNQKVWVISVFFKTFYSKRKHWIFGDLLTERDSALSCDMKSEIWTEKYAVYTHLRQKQFFAIRLFLDSNLTLI